MTTDDDINGGDDDQVSCPRIFPSNSIHANTIQCWYSFRVLQSGKKRENKYESGI